MVNDVICLCWNCGKEIHSNDNQNIINEEIWCDECVKRGERNV